MKYTFLLLSVLFILSCSSEDELSGLTPEQYIAENNLDATLVEEGVYIIIDEPGNSTKPGLDDFVFADFKGYLTDGTKVLDQDENSFLLGNEIEGWRIGLPQIGEGGSCTLIVAYDKAYGEAFEFSQIPKNSAMIFDINLNDVFVNQSVDDYISENNLTTTELDGGVHMQVVEEGGARMPTLSNSVRVSYTGRLTNGFVFDSGFNITFDVSGVIQGWQTGLQAMGEKGKSILVIPPDQGYGESGNGSIPPNSTLIFDVELLDVD